MTKGIFQQAAQDGVNDAWIHIIACLEGKEHH